MVYDPATNQAVMFGGDQGAKGPWLGDAWVLSNANGQGGAAVWTQLQPVGGPSARSGQWAVWDASNSTMYVGAGNGSSGMLADTWQLTGAITGNPVWSQLATTGSIINHFQQSAILVAGTITTFGGASTSPGTKAQYWSPTYDQTWQVQVSE